MHTSARVHTRSLTHSCPSVAHTPGAEKSSEQNTRSSRQVNTTALQLLVWIQCLLSQQHPWVLGPESVSTWDLANALEASLVKASTSPGLRYGQATTLGDWPLTVPTLGW